MVDSYIKTVYGETAMDRIDRRDARIYREERNAAWLDIEILEARQAVLLAASEAISAEIERHNQFAATDPFYAALRAAIAKART